MGTRGTGAIRGARENTWGMGAGRRELHGTRCPWAGVGIGRQARKKCSFRVRHWLPWPPSRSILVQKTSGEVNEAQARVAKHYCPFCACPVATERRCPEHVFIDGSLNLPCEASCLGKVCKLLRQSCSQWARTAQGRTPAGEPPTSPRGVATPCKLVTHSEMICSFHNVCTFHRRKAGRQLPLTRLGGGGCCAEGQWDHRDRYAVE